MRNQLLAGFLLLAGCSPAPQSGNDQESGAAAAGKGAGSIQPGRTHQPTPPANAAAATESLPPVEPSAPGTPGGLPDQRNPLSEAPFAPNSAQAAANLVQTYYALLESGRYGDAWKLWSGTGEAGGMSREAFAASFARYAEYRAQIGAPGEIEGAAGSLYVEVPVIVYGRTKSGEAVHMSGTVTLRRVNDVPGSTADQRQWHITAIGVRPRPR
jgi:hypothetical protein